jgi:hypothetical protein
MWLYDTVALIWRAWCNSSRSSNTDSDSESSTSTMESDNDLSQILYQQHEDIRCTIIGQNRIRRSHLLHGIFSNAIVTNRHSSTTVDNLATSWYNITSWGVRISGEAARRDVMLQYDKNVKVKVIFEARPDTIYKAVVNRSGATAYIMLK